MAMRSQIFIVGGISMALVGLLIAGLILTPDIAQVQIGSRAPDFQAIDLETADTVSLSDLEGEVVLLNIWATWCGPCEQEMPSIQRLYDRMASEGLRVLAVSVDQADSDRVRRWVEERDLSFPILHDRSGRIERTYQTTGLPETFLIDHRGEIVYKIIGGEEWDHPSHIERVRRLLEAAST